MFAGETRKRYVWSISKTAGFSFSRKSGAKAAKGDSYSHVMFSSVPFQFFHQTEENGEFHRFCRCVWNTWMRSTGPGLRCRRSHGIRHPFLRKRWIAGRQRRHLVIRVLRLSLWINRLRSEQPSFLAFTRHSSAPVSWRLVICPPPLHPCYCSALSSDRVFLFSKNQWTRRIGSLELVVKSDFAVILAGQWTSRLRMRDYLFVCVSYVARYRLLLMYEFLRPIFELNVQLLLKSWAF